MQTGPWWLEILEVSNTDLKITAYCVQGDTQVWEFQHIPARLSFFFFKCIIELFGNLLTLVVPATWELRLESHLNPGVQDQPGQHSKSLFL
jgi:hypothetical protein